MRDVAESELELVDEVIRGKEPLPVAHPSVLGAAAPPDEPVEDDALAQAFGAAAQAHSRPGYDLAPVMLTWDRAVFVVSTPERNRIAFATVSAPLLPLFFSQLQGGALDEAISSYLELAPGARRLRRPPRAGHTGDADDLGAERAAAHAEGAARRGLGTETPCLASDQTRAKCGTAWSRRRSLRRARMTNARRSGRAVDGDIANDIVTNDPSNGTGRPGKSASARSLFKEPVDVAWAP